MSIEPTVALANSDSASPQALTIAAQERLRQFVARIERVEEEKAAALADLKEIYNEAKSTGFDVKALRKIVAIRKIDRNEREEAEMILDLYLQALGELT